MNPSEDLIIKGYRGGVLITLPHASCFIQRDMLIRRIQSQERFFKGGRIALDVGDTVWTENQVAKLLKELSDEGVCLWAILSTAPETIAAANIYDIPSTIKRDGEQSEEPKPEEKQTQDVIWLEKDIFAGESLHIEGKLCLIGDVQQGAELSTDHSVLIWGKAGGEISAGKKTCPHNAIYLKHYDGANLRLNGEEVTLPPKLKAGTTLSVRLDGQKIVVDTSKEKRFSFL